MVFLISYRSYTGPIKHVRVSNPDAAHKFTTALATNDNRYCVITHNQRYGLASTTIEGIMAKHRTMLNAIGSETLENLDLDQAIKYLQAEKVLIDYKIGERLDKYGKLIKEEEQ